MTLLNEIREYLERIIEAQDLNDWQRMDIYIKEAAGDLQEFKH